jgi:hypothetical protein
MKRVLTLTSLCAVLLAVALAGQAKPSFAGNWKPVPGAAAGDDPFTYSQLVAAQDDKTLTVTVTGQMGEIKTTYNLDGTEAQSPLDFNGNSIDRVTKLAWDGGKLVLTATSNFNGQSFEIKEVWSMSDDGSLMVEATRPDFQGGGGPITTKTTYKKS